MPIRCEIVSQDRVVFQDDADIVVIPGESGEMGILPNHSPLLTVLKFGVVTVRTETSSHYFTVAGGVAEIQPDQITLLADAAEDVEEIDIKRAQDARERAEETLSDAGTLKSSDQLDVIAALNRSTLRLDAVRKYRGRNIRID
ncbi:MAG: ATP synthase F1 subunit epsilon [Anaerolineaceae bacterium]|nr:ATP synthase F1 subunit epsilon [Anaerolineaceae bacterium]